MQARRRAVEADIGGDRTLAQRGVQPVEVRGLVQEAAACDGAQEV